MLEMSLEYVSANFGSYENPCFRVLILSFISLRQNDEESSNCFARWLVPMDQGLARGFEFLY